MVTEQAQRTDERISIQLSAWSSMLKALPTPAAIVTPDGVVVAANRWLSVDCGATLLAPESYGRSRNRFGIDGSRWRVRPLDEDGSFLLATGEREDAGDHLLRHFYSSGDALFVVYDHESRIIQSNPAWQRLVGLTSEEVFGMDTWELATKEDASKRHEVETELLTTGKSQADFRLRGADGTIRTVRLHLQFDATVGRCFGIGRDITEEGRLTAELERRAFHDELTGLHNRASLMEHLEGLLADGGSPSLLFCDMDRFKIINDSLGHAAGDKLLAELGTRLLGVHLGDDARMGRFGGDEFVVVLGSGGESRAGAVAESIQEALREPFDLDGRLIHVTMSIGISTCSAGRNRTAEELLGDADTAAYEAKARGREQWIVFDDQLQAAAQRRLDVEAGLRKAIADGDIEAFFQPIVAVPEGRTIGAEALVRWRTADGVLAPGHFLDVAEDAGLMPEIGKIMVDATIAAAEHFATIGCPITMSLNVSDQELKVPGFCDTLIAQVLEAGLEPSSFLIEITESAVLATDRALPVLRQLRGAGFRIGLDDFGTGFSSLAHLRELPIDVVKVDRSFVADLPTDPVAHAVTASIVSLCGALDLDVVIEGIETPDQAAAVLEIGGTVAQGYLFHRPMPIDDLESVLIAER